MGRWSVLTGQSEIVYRLFIAEKNPSAADRFLDGIDEQVWQSCTHPQMGELRSMLPLRSTKLLGGQLRHLLSGAPRRNRGRPVLHSERYRIAVLRRSTVANPLLGSRRTRLLLGP